MTDCMLQKSKQMATRPKFGDKSENTRYTHDNSNRNRNRISLHNCLSLHRICCMDIVHCHRINHVNTYHMTHMAMSLPHYRGA